MERKTARISKEPEVRRQEILDTAMSVFMEKGYEAATMRDIAPDTLTFSDLILTPSMLSLIHI